MSTLFLKLIGNLGMVSFKIASILWDILIVTLVALVVAILWPVKWMTDPKPVKPAPGPIRASEAFPLRKYRVNGKKEESSEGGWLWAIIWRFLMLLVILVVHGYRKGKR